MDACMAGQVGLDEVLMGWVKIRTGEIRRWRCWSLKHMMLDNADRNAHNPYVHLVDFMRCADEVISYGFPRPASNPDYTALHKQFNGTSGLAIAVINDLTGDVVTIYTVGRDDQWSACANSL